MTRETASEKPGAPGRGQLRRTHQPLPVLERTAFTGRREHVDLPGRAIIALKRVSPVPSGDAIVREHLLSTPVCQALCPENVLLNVNWSRFSPPDPSVADP